jgi:glycosyltransferase involved in cell wall biosynthesis
MRVLAVHNKYQIRGGEDTSRESKLRLLTANGHSVREILFDNTTISGAGAAIVGIRASWNQSSYEEVRQIAVSWKPDVMDVDNFFPIGSPAVFYSARDCGVPVVQTLHNYRLMCPGGTLFRKGKVCEVCVGKRMPWAGVAYGCYRDSRAASAAVSTMLTIHNVVGTWAKKVTLFVTLTEFSKQKFVEGGIPEDRIFVKPNFLSPDPGQGPGDAGYVLFAGRLTEEKGIPLLLEAWKRITEGTLIIAGDGPLAPAVRDAAQTSSRIRYVGPKTSSEVQELMGRAKALVFPSIWFEGFPMVIVESLSRGTPVVANRLGSMAEIIRDGETGWLIEPGDPTALARTISRIFAEPQTAERMRSIARNDFQSKYTAERNYEALMLAYSQAIRLGCPKN